jgi:hypothetical protein
MQLASMIRSEFDDQSRRAIFTVPAGLSCARSAYAVAELLAGKPALGSYDWIVDVTANDEGASNEDVEGLAGCYRRCAREPGRKFTCVITRDPYFSFWAPALDLRFKDRIHKPFLLLNSAVRFLDAERS